MTIYRGYGGVNRTVKQQFRGVGGVNREIKEQYRGVGGVNRKVFENNFYTDFSTKSTDWTEYGGGTFRYGAGFYGNSGELKGGLTAINTILSNHSTGWKSSKYLRIPYDKTFTEFTLELEVYAYTSVASEMINLIVGICNNDADPLFTYARKDAWAGDAEQVLVFNRGRSDDAGTQIYTSTASTSMNGVIHTIKITFTNGILKCYSNNTLLATTTIGTPLVMNNIKIGVLGETSYALGEFKISYLKITKGII